MIVAIDPGKNGGIAWVSCGQANAARMPATDRELLDVFHLHEFTDLYIEDLVKYAGTNMPSSSMATYASNWGKAVGMATALGLRIQLVPPAAWQKALGLGTSKGLSKTEWKNKLKQRAEQLFPHIKVTLQTADALLILEAARLGKL